MLWVFPIEPLEERYSEQWYRWWARELRALGVPYEFVMGKRLAAAITDGQFLDVLDTNYFKATQLAAFCEILQQGKVAKDDWVLLHDAWNPSVASLAYMRDASDKYGFKIAGLLHAGTWDEHDYLSQRMMGRWAAPIEVGWMRALDKIFVASLFHAELIAKGVRRDRNITDKITVTGFPLYPDDIVEHRQVWASRPKRVVFPHRLAPEKDPYGFEELKDAYRILYPDDKSVEWVRSKDVAKTKAEYYALLGSARAVVSTAKQETWGIAMQEGAMAGCYPIVPNRLSYPEVFRDVPSYTNYFQAARLLHAFLNTKGEYHFHPVRHHPKDAIAEMCKKMGLLWYTRM